MQQLLWFETKGEAKGVSPIVLLHGFTGTNSTWRQLCESLYGEYHLILPDLPGHGKSTAVGYLDVDKVTDAILAMLDALQIEKTALLGYSLGGRIALRFAIKYTDRVSCVILESASPGILDSKDREERRLNDASLAEGIRQNGLVWFLNIWENLDLFRSQKDLPPEVRQGIRSERLENSPEGLASSLENAGAGVMPPMWSDLRNLKIPVLLIAGEKDEKYAAIARDMQRELEGSVVHIMKNAGHAVHLENPHAFQAAVEEFLGRVYK